ncbi:hypothetical protein HPB47_009586, partial [Ixodes persulcatus]
APPPQRDPSLTSVPIPLTCHARLPHLRFSRRTLPPPQETLTREDAAVLLITNPTPEQWEAALSSSEAHVQRELFLWAWSAAKATEALD